MGNKYQLVGSADPTSRIDRVEVAKGLVLELGGEPQELSDEQATKLSGYVNLRQVGDEPDEVAPEPQTTVAGSSGKKGS